MEQLKHDWLTDGMIDYEYKKYVLLAYLRDIKKRFDKSQLYPFLSDLVLHYKNLQEIKSNKEIIYEHFPKTISRADFKKLQFTYKKIVKDDEVMKELEEILVFAIPQLENAIREGKELYDFVEENMELSPVGLTPIYDNEGYLFINVDADVDVNIYKYQLTVFESAEENFRGIATEYIGQEMKGLSRTFEHIKMELAKRFRYLPNPATFLVVSKLRFPLPETVLPIAKRLLVKHISVS